MKTYGPGPGYNNFSPSIYTRTQKAIRENAEALHLDVNNLSAKDLCTLQNTIYANMTEADQNNPQSEKRLIADALNKIEENFEGLSENDKKKGLSIEDSDIAHASHLPYQTFPQQGDILNNSFWGFPQLPPSPTLPPMPKK